MSRRKILILENSIAFTGALKSITTVINFLAKDFTFYIAAPDKDLVKKYSPHVKIHQVKFYELRKNLSSLFYLPRLLINSFRILKLCKYENIDIVHINDIYNLVGVVIKIFKPGIKIIYHVRLLPSSYAYLLYSLWTKLVFKNADVVICVSQTVFNQLPKSDKKMIIYDALPIDKKFTKKEINTSGTIKILYLANYVKGKGQDFALEILKKILLEDPNVKLIFAGHTFNKNKNIHYKLALEEYVKINNLKKNVIFKNFVEDVGEEIKRSDFVLNLSESESFSLVCLEALIFGTPLLALNSGGPGEIVIHGKTGILFNKNDSAEEIGKQIVEILRNKMILEQLVIDGREHVIQKFSIKTSAGLLANIYHTL